MIGRQEGGSEKAGVGWTGKEMVSLRRLENFFKLH